MAPGNEESAARRPPYGSDAVIRRVLAEPTTALGASTALLLQVAHPSVAAAVSAHSDYARDPWARLLRTLDTATKLVFGDADTVARMLARLASRHAPVRGVDTRGVAYAATDPDLALWVWSTLVDVALDVHERVHGMLSARDRDHYHDDAVALAVALGVPRSLCPPSHGARRAYVAQMVDLELRWTPELDEIARSVLFLDRPVVVGRLVGAVNRWTASLLLPPRVRRLVGLPPSRIPPRSLAASLRALGVAMRLIPRPIRQIGVRMIVDHDVLVRLSRRRRRDAREPGGSSGTRARPSSSGRRSVRRRS